MNHTEYNLTHLASGGSVFHTQRQAEQLQPEQKKRLRTIPHSLLLQWPTSYFLT